MEHVNKIYFLNLFGKYVERICCHTQNKQIYIDKFVEAHIYNKRVAKQNLFSPNMDLDFE